MLFLVNIYSHVFAPDLHIFWTLYGVERPWNSALLPSSTRNRNSTRVGAVGPVKGLRLKLHWDWEVPRKIKINWNMLKAIVKFFDGCPVVPQRLTMVDNIWEKLWLKFQNVWHVGIGNLAFQSVNFFTSFPFLLVFSWNQEMHQRDSFCWICSFHLLQQLFFCYGPFGRNLLTNILFIKSVITTDVGLMHSGLCFRAILGRIIKKAVVTVEADWYLLLLSTLHQNFYTPAGACKRVLQQHIPMSLCVAPLT